MRRGALAVLLVGSVGLVLAFCLLLRNQGGSRSEGKPAVDQPMPVTGAPRLADSPPSRVLQRPSALDRLVAGIDAGSVVLDEPELMAKARAALGRNPALAEALAREARARFGDSPASDQRDFIVVRALLNQLKRESARSEAFYYFAHHPDGQYVEKISRALHMGIPHR
jgi:hypothetical protein